MINIDLLSISHAFWSDMANHLWQSTLFSVAAWLVTICLKKNRARVRYWIWFSVTIKFLIPFSLIVSLGGLIAPEWMKTPVENSPGWNVLQAINRPFNISDIKEASPVIDIIDSPPTPDKIPVIMISLWLCGTSALLLKWHKRGMGVSRVARKAEPLTDNNRIEAFHRIKRKNRISNTVQLFSTGDMMEPGVYGIFKPVLLLPSVILNHVNDSELEAILLHEFEHIRYKDNLMAFIHMIVQALFWFHPFVWLTGSRLVIERELACDESVLQYGKNPLAYAEGILKVCECYFKSPLVCVSGVIGSNLKMRVDGIVKNQIGYKLSIIKRLFLYMAGLSVLGIPFTFGIINAPPSQAHSFDKGTDKYNVNEYSPDNLQVATRPERNNESLKVFSKGQDHFNIVSNDSQNLRIKSPDETELKNERPAVLMANIGVNTTRTPEKNVESDKVYTDTALDIKAKNSVVLAQREALAKVTSEEKDAAENMALEPEAENVDEYISLGVSSLRKGQLKDAVSHFNKAINLDPGNAVAYVARGSAYFYLNRLDNAISDYNSAIDINPNLDVAYQNRGSVYYRQRRFENALADYNKAIELNPSLAAAYQDRGNIYQIRGQFDDAISDYSKYLQINPEDAVVYNCRGRAYFEQEQYQMAFADFDRAIELNPEYASAYIYRGTYFHIMDNIGSASTDYKKALELDPKGAYSEKLSRYLNYADSQEIECHRVNYGRIKKEICKTKAEWAGAARQGGFHKPFGTAPGGQAATSHASNAAKDNWDRNK